MKPDKFPLSWPQGYPETEQRQESKFICTFAQARNGIFTQLDRLGVNEFFISCNVKRNKAGQLVEGRLIYDNPGVAVYFTYKNEERVIACDKWKYIHENMRAVEKTIEAIRALERWGCSDIITRAMGNMKALAENAGSSNGAWWLILEVEQTATAAEIKEAHRRLSKLYHTDNRITGDKDKFIRVQSAFQQAIVSKL
jgi:hypothetical protein